MKFVQLFFYLPPLYKISFHKYVVISHVVVLYSQGAITLQRFLTNIALQCLQQLVFVLYVKTKIVHWAIYRIKKIKEDIVEVDGHKQKEFFNSFETLFMCEYKLLWVISEITNIDQLCHQNHFR